jgi:hypothetical protein
MAFEMKTRMEELEDLFAVAKKKGWYTALVIDMEGFPMREIIINHPNNLDEKLAYYKKTYTNDLDHKFAKGIRVVGVASGTSWLALQERCERYIHASDTGL